MKFPAQRPISISGVALLAVSLMTVATKGLIAQERSGPIRFRSNAPSTQASPRQAADSTASKPEIELGLMAGPARIPPNLKPLAEKGADAVARQDWDAARETYLEMVLQAPDNPLAYANLGVAEYQSGNLTAAEGNLRKSIDLNPTIAHNWITLGLIQLERGQLTLAISSLTRAVHEDPASAQAHLYLAAATFEKGWIDAAISELKRVIELEPNHAEAHYNLALTYLGLKPPRLELAKRHYFNALDLGAKPSPQIDQILKQSRQ